MRTSTLSTIRNAVCFLSVAAFTMQAGRAEEQPAEVETSPASPLGTSALTANGRIQPHGLPTRYWFEYRAASGDFQQTEPQPLPPQLAAYYHETWDFGLAGWLGGMSGNDLAHHSEGGRSGGFVRFSEPSGDDPNHVDGIGTLHLSSYFYPGTHPSSTGFQGWLGGGLPDFRDARVSLAVRGNDFVPNGAELVWWTQSDNDIDKQLTADWRRANWAYTGYRLTDSLESGDWEQVEYRLNNSSHDWTYGGHNVAQNRPNYAYDSINDSQARLSCDFFHLLAYVNPGRRPTGSIDFDEFTLAYRNDSLLHPANGGTLTSSPEGSADDPAQLTDGWRHGEHRMWRSAADPESPQEFVYEFATPVTIQTVQIHQHTEWPGRQVEVLTSGDGENWSPLFEETLPEDSPGGPNFAFLLKRDLERKATAVKVRILSGYRDRHWGLGEIEMFGDGAVHRTDDDWYHVNTDLTGLQSGATYHYRLIAENEAGRVTGPEESFTVPADDRPHVVTGEAIRIGPETATLTGRLTPMGRSTQFYFEYGPDEHYGHRTEQQYGGLQITPRFSKAAIEGLKPGTLYHYRLVGVNESGTATGNDATFRTATE